MKRSTLVMSLLLLSMFTVQIHAATITTIKKKSPSTKSLNLAQNSSQSGDQGTGSQLSAKAPDLQFDDSSKANRKGKSLYVSAQTVGAAVSPVQSFGLNLGYYVNRDLILQIEASSGTQNLGSPGDSAMDLSAKTFAANGKIFLGNSFYLKPGLMYRSIQAQNIYMNNRSYGSAFIQADSLGAEFAIGNQWQWKTFTLGCDWIGIYQPLATLSTNYYYREAMSSSVRADLDSSMTSIASLTSFEVLRLYLGASF